MIIGSIDLNKHLNNLSNIDLHKGIGKGISVVQEAAKANCPVFDGELRSKILTDVTEEDETVRGICWPAVKYGMYVEMGTGPKGQASHEGTSPDVAVSYSQSPWWIHESQISREAAEQYHFFYVDTDQGRFYQCTGQAAQPYLYPALKNQEKDIMKIIGSEVKKQL